MIGKRKGRSGGERLGKGVGSQLWPHARLCVDGEDTELVIIPTMFEAGQLMSAWGGVVFKIEHFPC